MKAKDILQENRDKFKKNEYQGGLVAIDNYEVIHALTYECLHTETKSGQETWVLPDDSYITRNDDVYWYGGNINLF